MAKGEDDGMRKYSCRNNAQVCFSEYVDRSLINDIGRLGSNALGIRSYGDTNIDIIHGGGSRSVGGYKTANFIKPEM